MAVNTFFPFGLPIEGLSYNAGVPTPNKERYNVPSTWLDDLGLDLYGTALRMYDPAAGRFMGVDPLADLYANQTPFQYGNNNPIIFSDPTGAYVYNHSHHSGKKGIWKYIRDRTCI